MRAKTGCTVVSNVSQSLKAIIICIMFLLVRSKACGIGQARVVDRGEGRVHAHERAHGRIQRLVVLAGHKHDALLPRPHACAAPAPVSDMSE